MMCAARRCLCCSFVSGCERAGESGDPGGEALSRCRQVQTGALLVQNTPPCCCDGGAPTLDVSSKHARADAGASCKVPSAQPTSRLVSPFVFLQQRASALQRKYLPRDERSAPCRLRTAGTGQERRGTQDERGHLRVSRAGPGWARTLYMRTEHIPRTCALYLHPVPAPCVCALHCARLDAARCLTLGA